MGWVVDELRDRFDCFVKTSYVDYYAESIIENGV